MASRVAAFSLISRESPAIVFVNRAAGRGRANACLAQIQELFDAAKFCAAFVYTESSGELESRARAAIAAGSRVLVAMGGDGTFQGLANAAFGSEVVLGVLPAGGGNDFAAALGLPGHPVGAAKVILEGRPRRVDLLRARTADGRVRLYGGGGGMGLDAEAARYAEGAYRRMPGRLRYIAAALRALREFKPLRVRAEFPDDDLAALELNVLLAGALNTPTYGAGLRLAADARIDDGKLEVVFVKEMSALRVLTVLPRLATLGELPESCMQRVSARRVRLTADRDCVFHGDGEILGPAPVEIEVVPQAVQVLAPVLR
jgi:YegS/Rv2252/BmrU family lipid kinase